MPALRQHIHIVAALDENTYAAGSADTGEEGQWNGDYERTRTADDEECQRTVYPLRPSATGNQWWDDGQRNGGEDYHRRVDVGELADEGLALRLVLARFLDKTDNLRCR